MKIPFSPPLPDPNRAGWSSTTNFRSLTKVLVCPLGVSSGSFKKISNILKMFKNIFSRKIILFIVFFLATAFFFDCLAFQGEPEIISAKGIILDVETKTKVTKEMDFMMNNVEPSQYYEEQNLKVQILSGQDKDKTVNIINDLRHNPFDLDVREGDKVFLYGENISGSMEYYVRDFWHLDSLLVWIVLFFALVILLGKSQGLKSLFTLGVSLIIIFTIFIPSVQKGANPLQVAVLISLVISCLTLPIIHGFSKKALVSVIGTCGGILTAVIFSLLVNHFSHLNGLGTEDMRIFAISNPNFNFQGILFAGILIGALGAIMDVAVSISSGLQEIRNHKPNIDFKELIVSGMNIGKDIMGSMLNTLIFAYVGASIAVILIISQNGVGLMEFLNYGFVTEEIVRSLIGSLGLLATIPITAVTAGFIHKFKSIR